jgi:regulator of protease activity HflC (stomatin/prohibitin superfamily)
VNILHASLAAKYHITDPIAYLTNVYPMPDPEADVRSSAYRRYPEYGILVALVRDAVIETAARREALAVRGEDQDAFLFAVGVRLKEKLRGLEEAGASLGISVDPNSGIIAPKTEGMEAIMPPRQTQQVFDQVQAAESQKSGTITKARSEAQELLVNTAGPDYEHIASVIEREFELMRALSAAESEAGGSEHRATEVERLRQALKEQRGLAEELLATVATGDVRAVLQDAAIARDAVIKEAAGDYARFTAVRPEYLRNPGVFMSRLLDETYAQALDSEKVAKLYVPSNHKEVRLIIPRDGRPVRNTEEEKR